MMERKGPDNITSQIKTSVISCVQHWLNSAPMDSYLPCYNFWVRVRVRAAISALEEELANNDDSDRLVELEKLQEKLQIET